MNYIFIPEKIALKKILLISANIRKKKEIPVLERLF